jgi:hypothetical protein
MSPLASRTHTRPAPKAKPLRVERHLHVADPLARAEVDAPDTAAAQGVDAVAGEDLPFAKLVTGRL